MNRDTYAGRVRDIISQNRYTYAENNPVTFVDPSGHKKIGALIGNIVQSTIRAASTRKKPSNGMGANAGNAAQSAAKSAGSIVNTVKNTVSSTTGVFQRQWQFWRNFNLVG